MVKKYILSIFLLLLLSNYLKCQEIWTIGPTFHLNFGGEKVKSSFGFEVAYWNIDDFPYSLDGGIEIEKRKVRFYSEVQTGIGILGVSCGPVVELATNEFKINPGVQFSGWANFFLGIDARYRITKDYSSFSPGIYTKIPFGKGLKEYSENDDWDDWD